VTNVASVMQLPALVVRNILHDKTWLRIADQARNLLIHWRIC